MMEEDVSEECWGGWRWVEVEGHPEVDFSALRVCQEDSDVSWEGELGPERRKGSGTAQAPATGSTTGTFYHREFRFQPVS